jgi:hypothetical protein
MWRKCVTIILFVIVCILFLLFTLYMYIWAFVKIFLFTKQRRYPFQTDAHLHEKYPQNKFVVQKYQSNPYQTSGGYLQFFRSLVNHVTQSYMDYQEPTYTTKRFGNIELSAFMFLKDEFKHEIKRPPRTLYQVATCVSSGQIFDKNNENNENGENDENNKNNGEWIMDLGHQAWDTPYISRGKSNKDHTNSIVAII